MNAKFYCLDWCQVSSGQFSVPTYSSDTLTKYHFLTSIPIKNDVLLNEVTKKQKLSEVKMENVFGCLKNHSGKEIQGSAVTCWVNIVWRKSQEQAGCIAEPVTVQFQCKKLKTWFKFYISRAFHYNVNQSLNTAQQFSLFVQITRTSQLAQITWASRRTIRIWKKCYNGQLVGKGKD